MVICRCGPPLLSRCGGGGAMTSPGRGFPFLSLSLSGVDVLVNPRAVGEHGEGEKENRQKAIVRDGVAKAKAKTQYNTVNPMSGYGM